MIRKLEMENLKHTFPEVEFSEDYVIATYQAKVATSNIEKLAVASSNFLWSFPSFSGDSFAAGAMTSWVSVNVLV